MYARVHFLKGNFTKCRSLYLIRMIWVEMWGTKLITVNKGQNRNLVAQGEKVEMTCLNFFKCKLPWLSANIKNTKRNLYYYFHCYLRLEPRDNKSTTKLCPQTSFYTLFRGRVSLSDQDYSWSCDHSNSNFIKVSFIGITLKDS